LIKEWLYLDWTPERTLSYGITFFIIFGSCALFVQARKIWKNRSGASVSATWTLIFFAMFVTYMILGEDKRENALLFWQGVFRVAFYIPILIGLFRFKGFTKKDTLLARSLFLIIFFMVEYPSTREFLYSVVNFLGVVGVAAQGRLIQKEQKTGVVSPILLFAYAANATLWVWYTHAINDNLLFLNSTLFLAAYAYTIYMWVKIRLSEFARSA
jgi:hypothetical protein